MSIVCKVVLTKQVKCAGQGVGYELLTCVITHITLIGWESVIRRGPVCWQRLWMLCSPERAASQKLMESLTSLAYPCCRFSLGHVGAGGCRQCQLHNGLSMQSTAATSAAAVFAVLLCSAVVGLCWTCKMVIKGYACLVECDATKQ